MRPPFDATTSSRSGGPDCNPFNNNELQAATPTCLYSTTTSVSNVDYVGCGGPPSTNVTNAVQLLERMKHQRSNRGATVDEEAGKRGLVHNLKKSFEAKCRVLDRDRQRKRCSFQEDSQNNNSATDNEVRSLPPSPVSEHPAQRPSSPPSSREDLSVRRLVGAFEKTKYAAKATKYERKQPPIPPRKSSLDFTLVQTKLGAKHHSLAQYPRRGVAPLVKSWLNKPNEMRAQQSKPYPLAKLRFCQPRSGASSVFNTV